MLHCFFGSSIKFHGHTGWKINDLNPIWVRLRSRSQLSNPSDLPCWTCIFINFQTCYPTLVFRPALNGFSDNVPTYTLCLAVQSTCIWYCLWTKWTFILCSLWTSCVTDNLINTMTLHRLSADSTNLYILRWYLLCYWHLSTSCTCLFRT